MKYRCAGLSFGEIASIVRQKLNLPNYSETSAYNDIRNVLREQAELLREEVAEIRQLETNRLDQWLSRLQTKINNGDTKAIGTALAIQERRAKLLGLDAPLEVKVQTQVREQISEFLVGLRQHLDASAWEQVKGYILSYQAKSGNEVEPKADVPLSAQEKTAVIETTAVSVNLPESVTGNSWV